MFFLYRVQFLVPNFQTYMFCFLFIIQNERFALTCMQPGNSPEQIVDSLQFVLYLFVCHFNIGQSKLSIQCN